VKNEVRKIGIVFKEASSFSEKARMKKSGRIGWMGFLFTFAAFLRI
jgi:hypothetical protein